MEETKSHIIIRKLEIGFAVLLGVVLAGFLSLGALILYLVLKPV